MDLITWDSLLPQELFKDFPSIDTTGWDLAIDVYEQNGNIVVEMQAPGVDADKFDVSIKDGMLHVKGSREEESETEDKNYYRKEIHRGSFERHVTLPEGTYDESNLTIAKKDGTLKVLIPKT